jgi:cell division cycle 2-like protein
MGVECHGVGYRQLMDYGVVMDCSWTMNYKALVLHHILDPLRFIPCFGSFGFIPCFGSFGFMPCFGSFGLYTMFGLLHYAPYSGLLAAPVRNMFYLESCRSVDNYRKLNAIEEGTYGVVYRAQCIHTGDIVALKKLKLSNERAGFPVTSLREIALLLKLRHPHVVNLREVVVGREAGSVFLVMDFVEHDLWTLLHPSDEAKNGNGNRTSSIDEKRTGARVFSVGEAKELLRQLLSAVAYLHGRCLVHRDLKTSNLLLSNAGHLQVADFGLARKLAASNLTPVVATLWYRAPEVLLGGVRKQRSFAYDAAVDLWSVGCVMAELFTGQPLFPGKTELDQLDLIFKALGRPRKEQRVDMLRLERYPEHETLSQRAELCEALGATGIGLLKRLLAMEPGDRITAAEALMHSFFAEPPLPKDPHLFSSWPSTKGLREPHHSSIKPRI